MAYKIIKGSQVFQVNDLRNINIRPKGEKIGNPLQYTYSLDAMKGQSIYLKVPKQNGEYPIDFLETDNSFGYISNTLASSKGYVKEVTGDGYVFVGIAAGNIAKSRVNGRTFVQVKILVEDIPTQQYSGNFYQKGFIWGTTGSYKNYLLWFDIRDLVYGCQFTGDCVKPSGGNDVPADNTKPTDKPTDTNPTTVKTGGKSDNSIWYAAAGFAALYLLKKKRKKR